MRLLSSTVFSTLLAAGSMALLAMAGCGEDFQSGGGASGGGGGSGGGGAGTTSSTTSGTTSGTGGAGGGVVACEDLGEACSQCELAACPDIYCNCYANPVCQMVIYCLVPCPPGLNPCSQGCYAQHTAGIADAALAGHCAATECGDHCFAGLQPLPDCDYCLFENCEQDINACLADPACAQLLYCAQGCDSPACVDTCTASYQEGAALAAPLRACMNVNCSSECAWAD